MEPYREPGEVGSALAEAPPPEKAQLGAVRAVHAPPPLRRSLVVPAVVGLCTGLASALFGATTLLAIIFAVIAFEVVLLVSFRSRALTVTVYDRGLVLARKGVETPIAYEDIDEIWFELASFKTKESSPDLHGLRLVGFDGVVHRVPLTAVGGAALCNAILQKHAAPLAVDARKALAAGETLRFGRVRLDRTGITVRGAYRSWQDLRAAEVHPTRVHLYRIGLPLLSWRTIHLDRIPNPSVFYSLLAAYVKVTEIRVPETVL